MDGALAPEFFLYGEPPQEVEPHFLHLESLDERNKAANWNIQPHSHAETHHLFFIAAGRGVMQADRADYAFAGPCLLLVPAGCVHGFNCEPGTRGLVLTIARRYLDELFIRDASLTELLKEPRTIPLDNGELVDATLARLQRELAWTAPGHAIAAEALLQTLLVDGLRASRAARAEPLVDRGPQSAVLARFRALVEANYRRDMTLDDYAAALSVTPKRLRTACARTAACTPLEVIQDRRLLEAKRLMLYSNLSVAEAAYHLGFTDPAYFSRFFTQRAGVSPRTFRSRTGTAFPG